MKQFYYCCKSGFRGLFAFVLRSVFFKKSCSSEPAESKRIIIKKRRRKVSKERRNSPEKEREINTPADGKKFALAPRNSQ